MSKLKEVRMAQKVKQEVIAAHAGVAVATYSQYENGQRNCPIEKAERIAEFLGCALGEIFSPKKYTVRQSAAAAE